MIGAQIPRICSRSSRDLVLARGSSGLRCGHGLLPAPFDPVACHLRSHRSDIPHLNRSGPPPHASLQMLSFSPSPQHHHSSATTGEVPFPSKATRKYFTHTTPSSKLRITHPYARLYAKKDETKRRRIWNHAHEKLIFSPYELWVLRPTLLPPAFSSPAQINPWRAPQAYDISRQPRGLY